MLISPQGLVNQVLLACLASRVLWVPKVSQVPRTVPNFAMSRIDNRGPGARIPDSLNPLLQACAGAMDPQRVPYKGVGVRVGAGLGCMEDLRPYFHLFSMAPLYGP